MNFRFINIPVRIEPSFWIFFLLFINVYRGFSIESLILGAALIFSLLIHEYGHAFTASFFGSPSVIVLEAFGGRSDYQGEKMTAKQQFLITLNGPLLESLLIVLPYFLLKSNLFENDYLLYFLNVTMVLNLYWCLFNLIPVAPLDGGHLLRYFLEKKFDDRGYRISLFVGICSAFLVVPMLFYFGFYFFAVLLLIFGFNHYRCLKELRPATNKANPFSQYIRAMECTKNQDLDEAKKLLKKLLKSKDTQFKKLATESLAKLYVKEQQHRKSYELLLNADHQSLTDGKRLLCELAFEMKNYGIICHYSREIYEQNPTFETALLNAKAFALSNQSALSGAWLNTACQFEPKKKFEDFLQDAAFENVKDREDFRKQATDPQKGI